MTFGAKAKGSRLERRVAMEIRRKGLDKTATRMPLSGAAFGLETDIKTHLPYSFECKNQEKVKLWEWWEQTERGRRPFRDPVLVISSNYRPELVVMLLGDWLNLAKTIQDYEKQNIVLDK